MDTAIHPAAPALAISIDRQAMNGPQTVTVLFGTHPAGAHTFAPLCTLREADGTHGFLPLFRLGQAGLERRLLGLEYAAVLAAVAPERWTMTGSQICEDVQGETRDWSPVAVRVMAGLEPDACVRCALGLIHAHAVHSTPPEVPQLGETAFAVLRDQSEALAEAYRAVHPGEGMDSSPSARRMREQAAAWLWKETGDEIRWAVARDVALK